MRNLLPSILFIVSAFSLCHAQVAFEMRLGKNVPVEGWEKVEHNDMEIWVEEKAAIPSDLIMSAKYEWEEPFFSEKEVAELKKLEPNMILSESATERHIIIVINFTEKGAKRFEDVTENNSGSLLVFMFEGKVLTAPFIHEKITGGTAHLTGGFTEELAQKITESINGQ